MPFLTTPDPEPTPEPDPCQCPMAGGSIFYKECVPELGVREDTAESMPYAGGSHFYPTTSR